MAGLARLSGLRNRLNLLAGAVGEGREYSRQTLLAVRDFAAELSSVAQRQTDFGHLLNEISAQLDRVEAAQRAGTEAQTELRTEILRGLRRVNADEAWHRRRLRDIRQTAEYELSYTEDQPLISVLIATHSRLELLRTRTIPAILAQEYRNFEIVIVGDQAPFDQNDICQGLEDAPIRFTNLPMRGPYPEEPDRLFLVAGTPPFNEAIHLANGSWLAPFSDDDVMRPNHLRVLLHEAQEKRLEMVYGKLQDHYLKTTLGVFPPRYGQVGLQATLLHAALSFYEFELSDADFKTPNDWGMIERMLRTGVRCGMVDEVVADYYPSLRALGE